jgi:hypothetical protein
MVLRKTAQGMQRLQPDGTWAFVAPEAGGEGQDGDGGLVAEIDALVEPQVPEAEAQPGEVGVAESGSVAVLDIEVPGLLSTDGKSGVQGQRKLDKLRGVAKRNASRNGKSNGGGGSRVSARGRAPREIVVPASAAEVTGPDAQLGLGGRNGSGEGARRIVTRETPTLLADRPKWVKELFEAHFRSELALGLRHLPMGKGGKNRMKLSRADYAIGWLVMFDKAREDPGILRLRS